MVNKKKITKKAAIGMKTNSVPRKKPIAISTQATVTTKKQTNTTTSMDTSNVPPVQTPGPQFPEEKQHHTQLFVALGALIVLAGLFFAGLWFVNSRAVESVEKLESGETLTTAKQGRVVPGFPQDLLLEGSDAVESSYSLGYEGGVNQPVVRYVSSRPMSEVTVQTRAHFRSKGWIIVKEADPESTTITNMYVAKDGDEANIVFTQKTERVVVEIAIVDNPTQ